MTIMIRTFGLALIGVLAVACSSTTMSGSWSEPGYEGKLNKVFVIGVAKQEVNRRIFEDTFGKQLASQGVKTVSSYQILSANQEVDKDAIVQAMRANGCESVLMTKLIGQRTETVTTAGYASGYSSGYGGRGGYGRGYGRGGWGNYYNRSYDVVYQPATSTDFVILTVESVLYDLETEEMIWSAQLETVVEGNIEKMMQDFSEEVTKDLKSKGLI